MPSARYPVVLRRARNSVYCTLQYTYLPRPFADVTGSSGEHVRLVRSCLNSRSLGVSASRFRQGSASEMQELCSTALSLGP